MTAALPRSVAILAAIGASIGLLACGEEARENIEVLRPNLIEENPENSGVRLTIGSKNFTEQFVLAEIYAQALKAAGYDVAKRLDLGSERVALRALRDGTIDAYPEYTSTALTSLFGVPAADVPSEAGQAYEAALPELDERGLVALPPTPFSSANAVGLLTEHAEQLGVSAISELGDDAPQLTLAGSPECRTRADCLVGLEDEYGLEFGRFREVPISRRYEVLETAGAELSILFTTDPQLFVSDNYVILEDDLGALPPGNVLFVVRKDAADEAGEDLGEVVERVQSELSLERMQELNARVDIGGETPTQVARSYLEEFGFVR
jgi:osmoprotectant transport system substrate-binding protein